MGAVSRRKNMVAMFPGSRTTSRRDFKPKGLQAEIKTLQAPQNAILSSAKCCFSKNLASLVHSKRYS